MGKPFLIVFSLGNATKNHQISTVCAVNENKLYLGTCIYSAVVSHSIFCSLCWSVERKKVIIPFLPSCFNEPAIEAKLDPQWLSHRRSFALHDSVPCQLGISEGPTPFLVAIRFPTFRIRSNTRSPLLFCSINKLLQNSLFVLTSSLLLVLTSQTISSYPTNFQLGLT
jgi:hypothetical protein